MPHPPTIGFPVNLMLAGKRALVVGGGRIGWRKTQLLLDARAAVTVVCPEACAELRAAAEQGLVTHLARRFEPGDLAGVTIAFAATSDAAANRAVLECAKAAHVLACAADENWPAGDFVTPASVRRGGLQVSVSTGGRSCRQSRLVKESLGRHLATLETLDLVVIGTSHEVLSAAEREKFHLNIAGRERIGGMIRQVWGVHEFFILNTCNRIELVAVASGDEGTISLLEHLMRLDLLDDARRYRKRGAEAFMHLALVTAGMLSQSPGETHIAAQMKEALEEAKARGWTNGTMREWMDNVLHVSKEIRTHVGPMLHGGEIEDVCLAYLEQAAPVLRESTVMVLGSGVIGRSLVGQFVEKGCRCVWCYHLNRPELPAEWTAAVELCTLNGIRERLGGVNAVISAVEAPGHVLHEAHAPFFDQEKNVLVIDLAMPRTVDPRLDGQIPGLRVVDLDGLKQWHRRSHGRVERAMDRSRTIVEEHADLYERIRKSIQGGLAGESAGAGPNA